MQLLSAVSGTPLQDDFETIFNDIDEWLGLLKEVEVELSSTVGTEDEDLVCLAVCLCTICCVGCCVRFFTLVRVFPFPVLAEELSSS